MGAKKLKKAPYTIIGNTPYGFRIVNLADSFDEFGDAYEKLERLDQSIIPSRFGYFIVNLSDSHQTIAKAFAEAKRRKIKILRK